MARIISTAVVMVALIAGFILSIFYMQFPPKNQEAVASTTTEENENDNVTFEQGRFGFQRVRKSVIHPGEQAILTQSGYNNAGQVVQKKYASFSLDKLADTPESADLKKPGKGKEYVSVQITLKSIVKDNSGLVFFTPEEDLKTSMGSLANAKIIKHDHANKRRIKPGGMITYILTYEVPKERDNSLHLTLEKQDNKVLAILGKETKNEQKNNKKQEKEKQPNGPSQDKIEEIKERAHKTLHLGDTWVMESFSLNRDNQKFERQKYATFTVEKIVEPPEDPDLAHPDEGMKFLSVQMTLKSIGDGRRSILFQPNSDVYLTTENGRQNPLDARIIKRKNADYSGIEPGGYATYVMTFQVPENAKDLKLIYDPMGIRKATVILSE
ncbi:MAG TPA: DUF4352 domain-containing protein [Bacillales bacterium]